MTNPNRTLIVMLIDASGSMAMVKQATIEGCNSFLDSQRNLPGECYFYLSLFNDDVDNVCQPTLINEFKGLDDKNYNCIGATALLDAIGQTISDVGHILSTTDEQNRPSKVIFVIQTDGQENTSKKYKYPMIADMVKHQTEKYGWNFVFLGANQDAIASAAMFGVNAGSALSYTASPAGTGMVFRSVGSYSERLRGGALETSFTPDERKASMAN